MEKKYRILVINPGSTSTKLAIYEDEQCLVQKDMDIAPNTISGLKSVFDQYDLRMESIRAFLKENRINLGSIDAIAARGCGGGNQKAGGVGD